MIVAGRRHWWQRILTPGFVLASPAVFLYTAFFVWPALQAFYVSLHSWTGFVPKMEFVGLDNFRELIHEDLYLTAVLNNFVFMIGAGVIVFVFSLLFAAALSNRAFPGRRLFKTVLFMPHVISIVAIAIFWTFIYDPNWGLLNSLLSKLSGQKVGITWLGNWEMAISSISAVIVWAGVGFYVVLLVAGIDRIPDSLYEAARIDGASEYQNFFHITFPLLREVMVIAISLHIIGSLKQFGLIWAMTQGTNYTHVMASMMYDVAFGPRTGSFRMGYGTAMAVVLFVMVVAITFIFNFIMRRAEVEY